MARLAIGAPFDSQRCFDIAQPRAKQRKADSGHAPTCLQRGTVDDKSESFTDWTGKGVQGSCWWGNFHDNTKELRPLCLAMVCPSRTELLSRRQPERLPLYPGSKGYETKQLGQSWDWFAVRISVNPKLVEGLPHMAPSLSFAVL